MRAELILFIMILPFAVNAEEPGRLENEGSAPVEKKGPRAKWLLTREFEKARGLYGYEVRGMHFNRVSCDRRMFAPSGRSVEGDGDLKATNVDPGFMEIEFPTHFSFVSFGARNPYRNEVADVGSVTGRQLLKVSDWVDGESLKVEKWVEVSFVKEGMVPQVVMAVDEVRVMGGYPTTFLVRETVFLERAFSLYMVCR